MRLTRRGRLTVIFLFVIMLWTVCMLMSHVVVDCDLRANSVGPCQVIWVEGGL